jgi:hypothetical protein
MWNISNNSIYYGANRLSIIKDSVILENIKIFLLVNNSKTELAYTRLGQQIDFEFIVKGDADYKILFKEKNEVYQFDLSLTKEIKLKEIIEIEPSLSYLKGIITLNLFIKNIKSKHKLVIEGDINRTIEVNRASSQHTFHHLINDFKTINFKINGFFYSFIVIDCEKFPTKLNKISYGVRLNKVCKYDLTVNVDNSTFLIPAGQTELPFIWDGVKTFTVLFNDNILFSQEINKNNYKPDLILIPDPLRVKIGSPSLNNIEIQIKGYNKLYILEAGKTEMMLDLGLEDGYRIIEIERVTNAIPVKNTFTFLIK